MTRQSLIAAAFVLSLVSSRLISAEPPNIIHIVVDDLGWNDVGFHGSEIKTPEIDGLAAESVVLDRFYVTPICSPTRAGVLSGRYPFRFGIWGGVVSPAVRHGLPTNERTLPERLADLGYEHRIMLGKWHLGLASTLFHPLNHGFTEFYGHYNGAIDYFSQERFGQLDWHRNFESLREDGYSTDLIGNHAVEFIDSVATDRPFYMYIAFNAPHSPIQATRSDLDAFGFDPDGERAPNTDRSIAKREKALHYGEGGKGNTVRQTYSAMVKALDRNVGKILGALQDRGLKDNTIVLFHSDNGGIPTHGGSNEPLRGNKFTTWEGGVRVVAMIRWPSRLASGSTHQSIASYIDVLPTLVVAAGGEVPENVDGINLIPQLKGEVESDRSLILDKDTVVTDRWKLKGGELFDLIQDPEERQPVLAPSKTVLNRLQRDLSSFAEMVGPPTMSQLNKPKKWPPKEWSLPEESDSTASANAFAE
ncbi:MAG: arylsulfatase [Planctomycetota bacterium]